MFFRSQQWGSGQVGQPAEITEDAIEFARRFRVVSGSEERRAIELAASRFNRSCRALSPVDTALDLGIALEVLLMHAAGRSDGNSEITFKIASRAAWMLAGNPEERPSIFKKVQTLYGRRSSAVHTGSLKKAVSFELLTELSDYGDIVRNTLWKLSERGCFPNWTTLILGGGWVKQ